MYNVYNSLTFRHKIILTTRFLVRYRLLPSQRMSSMAWICAEKWGADGKCGAPPQMQNDLPSLTLVERG